MNLQKLIVQKCLIISAVIEEEISKFENLEDINMFLNDLGLDEPGLHKIIKVGYRLLNLITFYTVGPKEAHAWTVTEGSIAPQAAGKIHSDFEKGFIRAEIITYDDYVNCGGEQASKEAGKMRVEGKTYIMNDSDIINVLFNILIFLNKVPLVVRWGHIFFGLFLSKIVFK